MPGRLRPDMLGPWIPQLRSRFLTALTFAVFLVLLIAYHPLVVRPPALRAPGIDRPIPTSNDSGSYQRLAVNLALGHGYTGTILEPPETYHLDLTTPEGRYIQRRYREHGAEKKSCQFFRAPGWPAFLALNYRLFGNRPRTARLTLGALAGAVPVILLLAGTFMAGWVGAWAAGLSGLYYLQFAPMLGYLGDGKIYTEIPAAFVLSVFTLLFVLYLRTRRAAILALSALCLACFVLTRANFLPAVPLLLIALWFVDKRHVVLCAGIVLLPLAAWSALGTLETGRFVVITTQGSFVFPLTNNEDVLRGRGPGHKDPGYWHPEREVDETGRVVGYKRAPAPGESGWIKGLVFWIRNLEDLPRLFYVKLRLGFWYDGFWYDRNGAWCKFWGEGFYLVGIAFLLICVGFRPPGENRAILRRMSSAHVLGSQLLLVCLLFVVWNQFAFWLVECIWLAMLALALLRPYGDAYRLPFPSPVWFLAFIGSHAIATMLFIGVRYHWPLDPVLLMLSFLGIGMCVYELLKRHVVSALAFVAILAVSMKFRYLLSPEGLLSLVWQASAG